MKKIIILVLLITTLAVIYYIFFKTKYAEYKTFKSPNNEFSLVVFIESNPYSLSFNSDFEYRKANVILNDKNNNTIAKPSFFSDCDFTIGDLNVQWDTINKIVYYNKFDSIDLKKMEMSCN